MRKFSYFVLLAMIYILLTGCVRKTDNTDPAVETSIIKVVETNEFARNTQNNTKMYILKTDRAGFVPEIFINETDKTFSFSYDVLSSYIAIGTYTEDEEQLVLKTDDGKYHYTFDKVDDHTLKFNQENSSEISFIDKNIGAEMKDGVEFIVDIFR